MTPKKHKKMTGRTMKKASLRDCACCPDIGRGASLAVWVLAFALAAPASSETHQDNSGNGTTYAGIFAGTAKSVNEVLDITGFANWGSPGYTVKFAGEDTVGSALVGKSFESNGIPLRMEFDGTFGSIVGSSDLLDPTDKDETGKVDIRWVATARLGLERDIGNATVFATGGVALAQINQSITDIDFSDNAPAAVDPDDSFTDSAPNLGWVVGVGVETPVSDVWSLRLEGLYMEFESSLHNVNHSGDGRCGPGNARMPCPFGFDNDLTIIRLGVVRELRF